MLRRSIERDRGKTHDADRRTVLQQQPTRARVLVAEETDGAKRDAHCAPEVDVAVAAIRNAWRANSDVNTNA